LIGCPGGCKKKKKKGRRNRCGLRARPPFTIQ
jgi:hypothetical protein